MPEYDEGIIGDNRSHFSVPFPEDINVYEATVGSDETGITPRSDPNRQNTSGSRS